MQLLTIQDKKVLNILLKNKIYTSDFYHSFDDPSLDDFCLMNAYQLVMQHYGYTAPPIFCCVVGRLANFKGIKSIDHPVLLELYVPDEVVKLHSFTNWIDIIYQLSEEYVGPVDSSFDNYVEDVLDGADVSNVNTQIQATIPHIKIDWLSDAYDVTTDFIFKFPGFDTLNNPRSYGLKPIYTQF